MKFVVVTGLIHPDDKNSKRRPAVVLGLVNGRVAVAPVSTNPARTGEVLPGGVLLTCKSPAHAATGFHADTVIISIKDAALYSIDSQYVKNCRQIGVLDTTMDKRVGANLQDLMSTYDLLHCNRRYD
jgi:hypothetical protein